VKRSDLVRDLLALKTDVNRRIDAMITRLGETGAAPPATPSADAEPSSSRPFRGRPMSSKYPGTCCVCGQPYDIDDRIVWNGDAKQAAHLGCGQADSRAQR
jgi:hypothetical protein